MPAVGHHAVRGGDDLRFADAEIVDQGSPVVGIAQRVEAVQAVLPIAAVLIEQAIDDVLAKQQVAQVHR